MKRIGTYGIEEQRLVAEAMRRGDALVCPRCASALDEWPVPPRADVSYVRDRVWLVCGRCSRSLILDRHDPRL